MLDELLCSYVFFLRHVRMVIGMFLSELVPSMQFGAQCHCAGFCLTLWAHLGRLADEAWYFGFRLDVWEVIFGPTCAKLGPS